MTGAGDWRAGLDDADAALVDGYQSGFPVEERPFRTVGAAIGVTESAGVDRVRRLLDRGVVRRFGAVLNPSVIGSSTLAAVRAPGDRFDAIVDVINGYPQVNHNYRRDHEWNAWFVVTAGSRTTRDRILDEIEERTGCTVLHLPLHTDYYIDLEFPVVNDDRFARETRPGGESLDGRAVETGTRDAGEAPDGPVADEASGSAARERGASQADGSVAGDATRSGSSAGTDASATHVSQEATADLSPLDRRLLLEIQDGFPLSMRPYEDVGAAVDADVDEVVAAVDRLLDAGCIKRVGCVVDHVATGFDANCMVVWDVPDEELDARGERAGSLPYVTLCYHRPRRPELDWPYNLFTMVHGRDPAVVDRVVDHLAGDHLPFDHERLHSTETLKQTGATYEDIVGQ